MPTHLSITVCPICRRAATPLDIRISYSLPCFKDRVHIEFGCCEPCGFVFQTNPLTRADLETYYRASPRYRSTDDSPTENRLRETQLNFMAKAGLRQECSVLDIGADMGKLLDLVKQRFAASTAYMEDSDFACAYINAHGRHRQITELSSSDRFDWIVLSQVAEHIVDPIPFLKSIRSHLTPDGRIFVEVPAHSYWDHKDYGFSFEHVNYFSPATLASTLRAAGFVTTHLEVCTDERYFQGRIRIIRSVAQVSPIADLAFPGAVKGHHLRGMDNRFAKIAAIGAQNKNAGKIALYGAGELTDLVLNNTNLGVAEIAAIFDTDKGKHGTAFHGFPVRPPHDIATVKPAAIVVLSSAEIMIRETIRQTGFAGQVIGWNEL